MKLYGKTSLFLSGENNTFKQSQAITFLSQLWDWTHTLAYFIIRVTIWPSAVKPWAWDTVFCQSVPLTLESRNKRKCFCIFGSLSWQ